MNRTINLPRLTPATYQGAKRGPSMIVSSQARRIAVWATIILTGSNLVYLIGFAFYVVHGFAGSPQNITRLLASVSVFSGGPALVVLLAVLVQRDYSKAKLRSVLTVAFACIFACLAIANRIPQLFILTGRGDLGLFDLYMVGSPAQLIEFIAFGPFQGAALLLAASLFHRGGLSGWARCLFALSGIFTLAGGTIFILLSTVAASLDIPPVVGTLICLPSWVLLYPSAVAVTTRLLLKDRF